ncbi:mannose-6-phosphate isomerase-like isoform X2 [Watersipora subatra]
MYAELWMGTLATGPAVVKPKGILLPDYIAKNPSCLGKTILDGFNEALPFLFKVLSVNKSLSIQAHPNKKHAEELNRKFPDIYKDSNHKPEMALALTDFEGMCGFRPFSELQIYVKGVPELAIVLGEAAVESVISIDVNDEGAIKAALKQAFSFLMRQDSMVILEQVMTLVARLESHLPVDCIEEELMELIIRLNSQFPGDVGIFAAFFLNHMKLKPGEAMFLAANLPHAYLSGDCIECMATSDNVVRAGLTPKFKDVDTLVEMLDYTPRSKEDNLMSPSISVDDPCVRVFKPPVPDFAVHDIQIEAERSYVLSEEKSASIVIATEGQGDFSTIGKIGPGHVIFLPANESCSVKTSSNMVLYRALCLPQV